MADADPSEAPDEIRLPLIWVDADEATVAFCNQILFQQAGPDEYVLSLGHALPPPILGTPEERRDQISRVGYVGVKVNGRFSLTHQRVEELIQVLESVLAGDPTPDQQEKP